jgi:hypothetical protein
MRLINILLLSTTAWTASLVSTSGNTPLYETFSMEFNALNVSGNKFQAFGTVNFSKGNQAFKVDAFHDGGDTWRARFMPSSTGTWNYTWSLSGSSGSGSFSCTAKTNEKNRGHVKLDPSHSRYLVHDDGTPYYAWGGKWFGGAHVGPVSKDGVTNPYRLSDSQVLAYLNTAEQYKHNSSLLKVAFDPLEDDKVSWDTSWLARMEWLVKEMGKRGIYCQMTFFCTWARAAGNPFSNATVGTQQVMNVWKNEDNLQKENYIRYVVARFGGFHNVYWELGNEILSKYRNPGDPVVFREQANSKYIPWIKKYDPYGMPIGCSYITDVVSYNSVNVDMHFPHDNGTEINRCKPIDRPLIQNEPCNNNGKANWRDEDIRDPATRKWYRYTFWHMFALGGCGAYQASWLNIENELSTAVYNVMGDQKRFREFLEALPVSINEMDPKSGYIVSGPSGHETRAKSGECYVTYWFGSASAGTVTLNIPAGNYLAEWYNPSNGNTIASQSITGSSSTSFSRPAYSEDIVLLVTRADKPALIIDPLNTNVSTAKDYQWFAIDNNEAMYIDRNYRFTDLPEALIGHTALRTANDDKSVNPSVSHISFNMDTDVVVYVLYTDMSTTLEAEWLNSQNGWTLESITAETDLGGGEATRKIQSKRFGPGTITLMGNGSTGSVSSMYNVVVIPASGLTVQTGAVVRPENEMVLSACPNPFNPSTTITITYKSEIRNYKLGIFDIHGRKAANLSLLASGHSSEYVWNAGRNPSGIYIVQVEVNGNIYRKRLTLVK